jgi:hypothetical protein
MLSQKELLTAVEAAKKTLPDDIKDAAAILTNLYSFFNAYLLEKYPGLGYNEQAAATLTQNVFTCGGSLIFDGDFIPDNLTAIINQLAIFDLLFDAINTIYQTDNQAAAAAAILATQITANNCDLIN